MTAAPVFSRLSGALCPSCGGGLDPLALSRTRIRGGIADEGPVACPSCGARVRISRERADRWRAGLLLLPVALVWAFVLSIALSAVSAATGVFLAPGGRLNAAGIVLLVLLWAPVVWIAHMRFTPKVVEG